MNNSNISPELAKAASVLVRDQMAVQPGECVLITADTATDHAVVSAVFAAACGAESKASILVIPQLPFQGSLADPYVPESLSSAVKSCDVWIDLCFPYLAGSHAHEQAIKDNRVRYLLAGDLRSGGLARLYTDLDRLYDVQRRFDSLLARSVGRSCRVTTRLGTDVTFTLDKPPFEKLRRANKPGLNAVPGSSVIPPAIETVHGVIVVEAAFHEYYTKLSSPMTLLVDGRIKEIQNGGTDRAVMRRALLRAGGGQFGYVIHFTCGYHPSARSTGGSFIEDMRVVGSNAVGLGLPWWVPGGGENHPDAIMSLQSFWIDGERIIDDGVFTNPPELADAYTKLEPRYN